MQHSHNKHTHKRHIIGIECPKCRKPTSVHRTDSYLTWIRRVRICTNMSCLHAFITEESILSPDQIK